MAKKKKESVADAIINGTFKTNQLKSNNPMETYTKPVQENNNQQSLTERVQQRKQDIMQQNQNSDTVQNVNQRTQVMTEPIQNRTDLSKKMAKNKEQGSFANTKSIVGNLGLGFWNAGLNTAYYMDRMSNQASGAYREANKKYAAEKEMKDIMSGKQSQIDKSQSIQEKINSFKNAPTSSEKRNYNDLPQTSFFQEGINKEVDKNTKKIQQNIENTTNPVTRKIAELSPSIGQSAGGMVIGALNPALGGEYFMASAAGDYTRQALAKGMNDREANLYGTIMGGLEGATEWVGGELTKNVGKAMFKEGAVKGFKALGLDIGENFLEEAIMEPLQEAVATMAGGRDKADWSNMAGRMLESGINGAITSIIMGGSAAGVGKATSLIGKMQEGETVSQKDVADALKEINKREEIDIEKALVNSFGFNSQDLYQNTDARERTNRKLDNLAGEISQYDAKKIIDSSNLPDDQKASLARVAEKHNMTPEKVQELINNNPQGVMTENRPTTMENEGVLNDKQHVNQMKEKNAQKANTQQSSLNEQNYRKTAQKYAVDTENKTVKSIYDVASRRNIVTSYDDSVFTNKNQNAVWKTTTDEYGNTRREVVLNPNADTGKTLQSVMVHELTHDLEGGTEYSNLSKMVLEKMKYDRGYTKARQDLENTYANVYDRNADNFQQLVDQEAVADYLGENLGNQKFVTELVQKQDRNTVQKIYDWVVDKVESFKNKVTGNDEAEYWRKVKNSFEKAYGENYNNSADADKYSIAGKKGLKNIKDESIRKSGYENYKKAQRMAKDKISNEKIYEETGWFKDKVTGKMKFSFSDKDMELLDHNYMVGQEYKLEDMIKHDTLFEIYPQLRDYKVEIKNLKKQENRSLNGRYNALTNKLEVDINRFRNKSNAEGTLLHEIQHAIQKIEKFANGTTVKTGQENYTKNPGEVEARDTAKRFLIEKYENKNLSNKLPKSANIEATVLEKMKTGLYNYIINIADEGGSNEIYQENNKANKTENNRYVLDRIENSEKGSFNLPKSIKEQQLEIIQKNNPMQDDYHTGIRDVEDIKTLQETLQDEEWSDYDEFNPDLTKQDIENAIKSGKITVYSSYPIEQGVFVSPSRMEAEGYSSDGKVYSKEVNIKDVAWIDPTQGQYANVKNLEKGSFSIQKKDGKWQEFLKKNSINKGTGETMQEVRLPENARMPEAKMSVGDGNKLQEKKSLLTKTSDETINKKIDEYENLDKSLNLAAKSVKEQKKAIADSIVNSLDTDVSNYNSRIEKLDKRIDEISNVDFTQISSQDWIAMQDELEVREYERDLLKQKKEELDNNSDTLSNIALDKEDNSKEAKKQRKQEKKEILTAAMVNKYYAIDKIFKDTKNKNGTVAMDNFVDYQSSANTTIDGRIKRGTGQTDIHNNVIGKSINEIMQPLQKKKQLIEFTDYIYNLANIDRVKQNKKIFDKTALQSKATAEMYEKKYPYFKDIQKEVTQFFNNELQNTVDAGITSEETANYVREMYPNFASVYRKATDLDNLYESNRISAKALKKAVGSDKQVLPINTAMAEYALSMRKKIALNNLLTELEGSLSKQEATETINMEQAIDHENLLNGKDEKKGEETLQKTEDGRYLATYYKDGQAVQFEIPENIYNLLTPQETKNNMVKAINWLAEKTSPLNNAFRQSVTTLSPGFTIRNMIKDFQSGIQNSQYGGLQYTKNYIRGVSDILANTVIDVVNKPTSLLGVEIPHIGYTKEYINSGLGSNSKYDRRTGKLDTKYNRSLPQSIYDYTLGNVFKVIDYINGQVEMAGRMSEFISSLEAGNDINTAKYETSEVTLNFKRGGEASKTASRLGATFFNTQVLAVDKIVRNVTGQNGLKGYANLAFWSVLVPGGLTMLNQMICKGASDDDDDSYEALPDYIKDSYFLIPKGKGEYWRIPKNEVATAVGSTARRFQDLVQGNFDDSEGDIGEWISTVIDSLGVANPGQNNIFSALTQAANNEAWYGGSIVSESQQEMLPQAQYTYRTNGISKKVADKVARLPEAAKKNVQKIPILKQGYDILSSPAKSDYVLNQYGGGIADMVMPKLTPYAEDNYVQKELTTNSVLKSKYPGQVYDKLEEVEKVFNTTGEQEDEYNFLTETTKSMGALYSQKREMENDSSLSDDEKKKQEIEIQRQINQVAKAALDSLKNKTTSNGISKLGESEYYTDSTGKSKKIDEDKPSNLPATFYADFTNKVQAANKKKQEETGKEKAEINQSEKISILQNGKYSDDATEAIYTNYVVTQEDKVYADLKTLNGGSSSTIKAYLSYKQADANKEFEADKEDDGTVKGKSISGTAGPKYKAYLEQSDFTEMQMLYLYGKKYNKLTNGQKTQLTNYIKSLNITEEERTNIYKHMTASVEELKDGSIRWK